MTPTLASLAWTTNMGHPIPDPAKYKVDDLIVDLAPQRVSRAGLVIRLQGLSFDLLVTLVRAAPGIVTFEQLGERVWPGLVVTPETIVQRVKLLRSALGDDANTPRYIQGVRGRGYRMIADVRPLMEEQGNPECIVPPSFKEPHPDGHAGVPVTGSAAVSTPSATSSAARRLGKLGWVGGTLIMAALLAASWVLVRYGGGSKPAERASPGIGAATIRSLAVLPLANLSGDKEQEYFADGMTDALTTDLAQIGSLRVISRISAMHFKGSEETLPQIGHDLHVDAVVEGAVTRSTNRVRVTAQLIETSSDRHLWAKTYERDLKDVLVLQDEIAQDVAEQIEIKLIPTDGSLRIQAHTVDPEAYDAYLVGSYWLNQPGLVNFKKSCDYFQKAIAEDHSYAPAYVGLAECQTTPAKTRGLIAKALALDPSLADAHMWLGTIKLMTDWDWSGAEAEFKQAIVLNPNDEAAHRWYSTYLVAAGRLDEAMREIERARSLDPYSALVSEWRGQVLYHARRYDDALREMRRDVEMYPDTGGFYSDMADVYEQKKMFAEAFVARQRALSLGQDPRVTALAEAYKRSGYKGYLLKQAEFEQAHNPAYAAHIYALLDDEPRFIACMKVAYNDRQWGIVFIRTAPEFDSIRHSPFYRDLVRRIGIPQPQNDQNATDRPDAAGL